MFLPPVGEKQTGEIQEMADEYPYTRPDYYPPQIDIRKPEISKDEHRLIDFGMSLLGEGQSAKEKLGINRRIERAAAFLTGGDSQWPKDLFERKKHRAKVSLNLTKSVVERKAGMLTDTRPIIEIRSRSGRTNAAETLRKIIADGIWYERSIQQVLTDGIVMAQKGGYAPCYIPWDKSLDFGRGDVGFDFLPQAQVTFDPRIRRAADVQRGEYVIIETCRPLAEFQEVHPARGHLVKLDQTISSYSKGDAAGGRLKSPVTWKSLSQVWHRPSRQESDFEQSAIPYGREYQLYFRDRTLNPEQPYVKGTPNYLFPRKRVIIWGSGDVVLYDGSSKYWDGLYPVELLDWGIETDHPFGESEVDVYRSLQEAMNILISGLVDNARLINDPPKVIGPGVLPDIAAQLEQFWDLPGSTHRLDRPDDVVERPPGAQSQVVIAVVNLMKGAFEFLSGLSEATAGKRPPGIQSGVQLDALLLASQVVIRLQGRAVEDFLARVGRLLISRVVQFYDGRRVLYSLGQGANGEIQEAVWEREEFIKSLLQAPSEEDVDRMLQDLHRDMAWMVRPMSSLAVTKLQDYAKTKDLVAQRVLPRIELLKAAEYPNAEEQLQKAQAEDQEYALRSIQTKLTAGGGGMDGQRLKTPSVQKGGVGTEGRP